MNIGFVGLGKLGMPCALAIERAGHTVLGTDPSPNVSYSIGCRHALNDEPQVAEMLTTTNIQVVGIETLVNKSELLFVAVQTPHESRFEGISKLPKDRADFDYTALIQAVTEINSAAEMLEKTIHVAIISTVLPGTIRSRILPLCGNYVHISYNPYFIAMGSVVNDFLNPEFVLVGGESGPLVEFYGTIHQREVIALDLESAELVKVAYNTFIGIKIAFANTLMEICHRLGGNVDSVTSTLSQATDRLISGRYLRGGMGDGGGCHPRDNIAMSWLAQKLGLSHNLFDDIMQAREDQTRYLADLVEREMIVTGLELVVLGKAFKPELDNTVGSPAVLLANLLNGRGYTFRWFDPHTDGPGDIAPHPAVYMLATAHRCFFDVQYPKGSVVVDPFGLMPDLVDIRVVRVGRN